MHGVYILLKKEVGAFLSSLTGYIVIVVFLAITGLMMWVFEGGMNVLDMGQANVDTLFGIAPWVFMFLGPAITMRLLSDERNMGTLEILLTKPLSEWQIVSAKFLAGFSLMVFSLLPTLVFYLSVFLLGNPAGNIDTGGTWGSYLGLLLLSAAFVAMGLFASSLTNNPIVAFVVAVFLSFICYFGFEALGSYTATGTLNGIIVYLGIYDHYLSLSRGVIDSRDLVYFISLVALFLLFTKTAIAARKW